MSEKRLDETHLRALEATCLKSQSNAAAGEFAAAVMHEINNPLEAITNLSYLIGQYANDASSVSHFNKLLSEELAKVTRIAHRTLGFYKAPHVLEVVDMRVIADAAIHVHDKKISDKELILLKDAPHEAPIRAHSGEMLQVLSNLLSNAIDALPKNGSIRIRIRRKHESVHVTLADDGHGIPNELLRRIFEPFFTTKGERGTGLGLAISKSIIERHSGRMQLRSSVRSGRSGTTFRITLPSIPAKIES
jgi:signal transduction histidine kinase